MFNYSFDSSYIESFYSSYNSSIPFFTIPLYLDSGPILSILPRLELLKGQLVVGIPPLDVSVDLFLQIIKHITTLTLAQFQVFHSLYMAREIRLNASPSLQDHSIQLFISYILCSLGGGALSSWIIGQPPAWLGLDAVIGCYFVSFFIMHFKPFSSVFLYIFNIPLLLPFLLLIEDVGFAHALTSFGVDRALDTNRLSSPNIASCFIACMITGIVGGLGSGFVRHGFSLLTDDWTFRFPRQWLQTSNPYVKLSLTMPLFYILLRNSHSILPVTLLSPLDAKMIVISVVLYILTLPKLVYWVINETEVGEYFPQYIDQNYQPKVGHIHEIKNDQLKAESPVDEDYEEDEDIGEKVVVKRESTRIRRIPRSRDDSNDISTHIKPISSNGNIVYTNGSVVRPRRKTIRREKLNL